MLHLLSVASPHLATHAHSWLTTYFLVGLGLTGVSFFSGWFKKSYDGPLKQAWGVASRFKTEKQALEVKVHQLRQEYQYQAQKIEHYARQAEAYAAQIQTLNASYTQLQQDYTLLQADFVSLQDRYETSQIELKRAQAEIADLHSQLEKSDYENEQLRQACAEREEDLVHQATAHQQLQESYRLLEAEQATLNTQWQTTQTAYENLQASYQELQTDLREIQHLQDRTQTELTALESRMGDILAENEQLLADNLWRENRLQKLRFWEWLMGGCNNFVPRSKSLLTFYVGIPLQAWWQNIINPA